MSNPRDIADSAATINYIDGVTSDVQNQIDSFVAGVVYVAKTANYTTTNLEGVLADTSSGAFTITLPATPSFGDQVIIADSGEAFGTNNLTVGRNGQTIDGTSEDLLLDIDGVSVQFVFDAATWRVYAQVGGNGGDPVTLTGVQTLTNKTLTAPVITTPRISAGAGEGKVLTSDAVGDATWDTPEVSLAIAYSISAAL